MVSEESITLLLREVEEGRGGALDDLMRVVHEDLQRMAEGHLRRQFGSQVGQITLEPAALVNESFLKLIRQRKTYDNRGQFFAIVTKVMIRVLIDYKRARSAAKRGGDRARVTLMLDERLQGGDKPGQARLIEIEDLENALAELDALDSGLADVVRMRVIWGMDVLGIAESLGVSDSTVKRQWRFAKAWLAKRIGGATE